MVDLDSLLGNEDDAEKAVPPKVLDARSNNNGGSYGGASDDDADYSDFGGSTGDVLNQEEIDNLLGYDDVSQIDQGSVPADGLMRIIEAGTVQYERLPMLEVMFDRLMRMLSTSLRNFTSDNVEVSLNHVRSVRFGDYINGISLPALIAVFKAEEWDNYGLITIDSTLIYSIVDVLLGGRRKTSAMHIDGRPYTTIERNLIERLVEVVLSELSAAMDSISAVTLRFERLESNPKFAPIAQDNNACVVASFSIDMEERGGGMDITFPYATLEPVREQLVQMFIGARIGSDSIWENHLTTELWHSHIDLMVILEEFLSPLSDVLTWQKGTTIPLEVKQDSEVLIASTKTPLFYGTMGRSGDQTAVKIKRRVQKLREKQK